MRGGGGQKMSIFVHAKGIKTVHLGGGGGKKWQNSVHVVVECPLKHFYDYSNETLRYRDILHFILKLLAR